jgi:C-methyltransferase
MSEQTDPFTDAMALLFGSHLLRAALKLGLPDAVGDEPVPVGELARRTGTDPPALHRLMCALGDIGVFRPAGGDQFAHTPVSRLLRSCEAGQLLGQGAVMDSMWQAWSDLAGGVRTGQSPFQARHGTDFYSHLREQDPEESERFHAAMGEATEGDNAGVIDALDLALDLATVTRVVDVGGGQGGLLRDVLARHPHLHGVLFDTDTVVPNAVPELRTGELASRCEIVAGDARKSVPDGADVYLLRLVLHNWDDDSSADILSSCAAAARPGARVVVIETLADDNPYSSIAGLIDIGMFVLFGGRERTEADFAGLFARAGLDHVGTTPTPSLHLITARRPG